MRKEGRGGKTVSQASAHDAGLFARGNWREAGKTRGADGRIVKEIDCLLDKRRSARVELLGRREGLSAGSVGEMEIIGHAEEQC